jgi:hypothetical protein
MFLPFNSNFAQPPAHAALKHVGLHRRSWPAAATIGGPRIGTHSGTIVAAGEPLVGLVFAVRGRASGEEHEKAFLLSFVPPPPNFCSLVRPPSEPLACPNTWLGPISGSILAIDLHCGIVGHCDRVVELGGARATRPREMNLPAGCVLSRPSRPIEGRGIGCDRASRQGTPRPQMKRVCRRKGVNKQQTKGRS